MDPSISLMACNYGAKDARFDLNEVAFLLASDRVWRSGVVFDLRTLSDQVQSYREASRTCHVSINRSTTPYDGQPSEGWLWQAQEREVLDRSWCWLAV